MTHIAIFPIPDCVTFPGMVFPLHVFEPRYRAMAKHCIEDDMLLAISHTEKLIRPAKSSQSSEEVLHSNQASYKPLPIFSAGRCELLNTLEDGRLYLNVHIQTRFKAISEVQSLPFIIYECEEYNDKAINEDDKKTAKLTQQKILKRLQMLTYHSPEIQKVLMGDKLILADAVDFSFMLFHLVQLESSFQQSVLEMQSVNERLMAVLELLNQR
ncbi:MAG: Lon protease-like protein [Alteromonas macleodii]|jgi:Lon protease-like protein